MRCTLLWPAPGGLAGRAIRAGIMRTLGGVLVLLIGCGRPVTAAADEAASEAATLPGPANLVVEASGRDIRVSWEAVPGAEQYQIMWRLNNTDAASAHRRLTDQTSVTLPNLSPGTYIVQVGVCQGEPPTCTPRKDQTKRKVKVRGDETLARLTRTFVGSATSVEEFALGLPKAHKHRATFMVDSQALDQNFVSEEQPRVISSGATADTIFAWGTNPASPLYEQVEFIAKEAGNWAFGVIDFATTPPTVERDETCQSCHIGDPPHPLWAEYPGWPGSVTTEYKVRAMERIEMWHEAGDPRLTAIPVWPDDFHHDRMAYELNDALAIRHGEVLIESVMPDEPAAGVPFAQELLCENDWKSNLQDLFPAEESPATMGDGQGGHRNVHPKKLPQENYESANNAALFSVIRLYLLNYLVEYEEQIKAVYEGIENTRSAGVSWRLHYSPGTATALDELKSRVQIAFALKGGKQLKYRRTTEALRFRDMQLIDGHLKYMVPKVCAVLDAE